MINQPIVYYVFRYNRLTRQTSCSIVRNDKYNLFSKTDQKLLMHILKQVLTGQCREEEARKMCADECPCTKT